MNYLARTILTVQGEVRLQRAYYYCQRCHLSYVPWDEVVGLADSLSPGLLPLVCLVGTLVPFAEAGDALQRLTGPRDAVIDALAAALVDTDLLVRSAAQQMVLNRGTDEHAVEQVITRASDEDKERLRLLLGAAITR